MRTRLRTASVVAGLVLTLSACTPQADAGGSDNQRLIEDMDMVVTAQQGRIQSLEQRLADLEVQLGEALVAVEHLSASAQAPGIDSEAIEQFTVKSDQLTRLVFQALAGEASEDALKLLGEKSEAVYRLASSPTDESQLFWVTGGDQSGEIYSVSDGRVLSLGTYSHVMSVSWSPNGRQFIIETESEAKRRGVVIDLSTAAPTASFEFVGMPVWAPDGTFFTYLNENPDRVYTGQETVQMHPNGVYLYVAEDNRFRALDGGGADYSCMDLAVTKDGEITYVRRHKDGSQSFMSLSAQK